MAYVLQSLLTIRTRREDTARGELVAARQKMAQAQQELSVRKAELQAYEDTREARRDRIYSAIIGRVVNPTDLEMAREGIARIDEEGNLRANNVLRAEDVVREREQEVEAARADFVVATKNRMKLDEHRLDWQRQALSLEDYRQEIELEDFTGKKVQDDRYN